MARTVSVSLCKQDVVLTHAERRGSVRVERLILTVKHAQRVINITL